MIVLYFLGYFYRNKQNSYAALTIKPSGLLTRAALCSEGSMFRRFYFRKFYVSKALCSKGSIFRRFYVSKVLFSEGSTLV